MIAWEDVKANLRFALPVMGAQLGQVSVNIADTLMIGSLQDNGESLAAVSLGNAIFITLLVFSFGFSAAISPLIASADARGEKEDGMNVLKHGLLINAMLVFFLIACVNFNLHWLYRLNQPKDVAGLAIPYLSWMMYSLIPLIFFQTLRQFCEGIGQVMMILYATIIANVLNVLFNYLLIFGKFGFTEMGVEGAAIGSLLSRVVMFVLILVFLSKNKKAKSYLNYFRFMPLELEKLKTILILAIPIAFQMLFEVGAFTAAAFISGYGNRTTDLAAHQITFTMVAISFMFCSGLGVAATVRVGNQYGLKNFQKLRKVGWSVVVMAIILMAFIGLNYSLLRFPIASFIEPDNLKVAILTAELLLIAAILQIPDGIQIVVLGALRGAQDVWLPTLISFFTFWGLSIPLGIYLAITKDMGAKGMWIALASGLYLSAFLLILRFNYTSKKTR